MSPQAHTLGLFHWVWGHSLIATFIFYSTFCTIVPPLRTCTLPELREERAKSSRTRHIPVTGSSSSFPQLGWPSATPFPCPLFVLAHLGNGDLASQPNRGPPLGDQSSYILQNFFPASTKSASLLLGSGPRAITTHQQLRSAPSVSPASPSVAATPPSTSSCQSLPASCMFPASANHPHASNI
ncbi:uncharacterized protein LOC133469542 [Phyllopteryx taeniolatus]|uniref:uncharacterized protein LOC133469542 n=1 Tax=Phyllopteryx taeniolatus TaxID=161469 RepID=UPI002AD25EA7|nr:uncharacterized protein LOC133469542 [Phyllopteryx taeniolatus]